MTVEGDLARLLQQGREVVVATVVRTDGSPPARAGAKIVLSRTAPLAGTLGCSEFDSAALADAAGALDAGTPQVRTYPHDLGSVEVFLEPHPGRPVLLVVSATPVAARLLDWGPPVGFQTTLVETRAERLAVGDWTADTVVDRLPRLDRILEGDVYAVLTDHDASDVVAILTHLLRHRPRFIGLVGSRRHVGAHLDSLRAHGFSDAELARIHTPVGLDLGGRTANEIALSILAGVVATRHGASGGWLDGAAAPG